MTRAFLSRRGPGTPRGVVYIYVRGRKFCESNPPSQTEDRAVPSSPSSSEFRYPEDMTPVPLLDLSKIPTPILDLLHTEPRRPRPLSCILPRSQRQLQQTFPTPLDSAWEHDSPSVTREPLDPSIQGRVTRTRTGSPRRPPARFVEVQQEAQREAQVPRVTVSPPLSSTRSWRLSSSAPLAVLGPSATSSSSSAQASVSPSSLEQAGVSKNARISEWLPSSSFPTCFCALQRFTDS